MTIKKFSTYGAVILLCALSGCQAIGNWFDSVGEHFPVIGERCEHWQCFTESGREISDANKKKQAAAAGATQATPAQATTPPTSPPLPTTPQNNIPTPVTPPATSPSPKDLQAPAQYMPQ
jgi:hypothetical protein